ncbi:hypothetical protein [Intrasporangium flavum]|uniref:hypothetical protein n=1 Tax=Intrasporangium flavum TaxID=1428657 RepID=UPI00096FCBC2|nr:hypothetical protein [Intrasporangium flavum]
MTATARQGLPGPAADRTPVGAHRWCTPSLEARGAGALLGVAGLVHVVVTPEHLDEWAPAGVFFAVVATIQLWLAQALWRGTARRVLPAAVLSTAGLVGLYVVSRTVGLPLHGSDASIPAGGHHVQLFVPGGRGNGMPVIPGSEAGSAVEAVGALDLVCVSAELAALALLVGLLPPPRRRSVSNLLLATGVCGCLAWAAVRFA